jgi:hypothetical protein
MMIKPGVSRTVEIAQRTRHNLVFFDQEKQNGATVFEFTQLLNSMLGMLIIVCEEYFAGDSPQLTVAEERELLHVRAREQAPDADLPKLRPSGNPRDFVRKMRNAFAHGNFELLGDREITGILVWNYRIGEKIKKPQNRTWQVSLTETEMRSMANVVCSYAERKAAADKQDT